jgi:hypothetical protein
MYSRYVFARNVELFEIRVTPIYFCRSESIETVSGC